MPTSARCSTSSCPHFARCPVSRCTATPDPARPPSCSRWRVATRRRSAGCSPSVASTPRQGTSTPSSAPATWVWATAAASASASRPTRRRTTSTALSPDSPRSSEREWIPLMTQHDHDPVLVTGCSTGIGRAVVEDLLRQGHTVWATARRPDTLSDLADRGAHVTALDVTDEASMSSAVAEVEAAHGAVGTLVNNAGYGEYGAVEEVDMEKVRAMFEANVFGLARMCQLVLPGMRRAGKGRIINIGSMGGRFTFPLGGYYHATEYEVEALTDALRVEVKPFGVQVVVIEPGITRSGFEETIAGSDALASHDHSLYAAMRASVAEGNSAAYANARLSASAESVAQTLVKAVEADRPRTRYLLTPAARAMVTARAVGGDRVWDGIVKRQFSL